MRVVRDGMEIKVDIIFVVVLNSNENGVGGENNMRVISTYRVLDLANASFV